VGRCPPRRVGGQAHGSTAIAARRLARTGCGLGRSARPAVELGAVELGVLAGALPRHLAGAGAVHLLAGLDAAEALSRRGAPGTCARGLAGLAAQRYHRARGARRSARSTWATQDLEGLNVSGQRAPRTGGHFEGDTREPSHCRSRRGSSGRWIENTASLANDTQFNAAQPWLACVACSCGRAGKPANQDRYAIVA